MVNTSVAGDDNIQVHMQYPLQSPTRAFLYRKAAVTEKTAHM